MTGDRLFDNHISIDLAKSLFDFGAPGFWELVQDVRIAAVRNACRTALPVMITTSAYSHPLDEPLLEAFETLVSASGGQVLPVFLSCSEEELMNRVGEPSRAARGKITSPQKLKSYLQQNNFAPVPRSNCLCLRTDWAGPEQSARTIADHFTLTGQYKTPSA